MGRASLIKWIACVFQLWLPLRRLQRTAQLVRRSRVDTAIYYYINLLSVTSVVVMPARTASSCSCAPSSRRRSRGTPPQWRVASSPAPSTCRRSAPCSPRTRQASPARPCPRHSYPPPAHSARTAAQRSHTSRRHSDAGCCPPACPLPARTTTVSQLLALSIRHTRRLQRDPWPPQTPPSSPPPPLPPRSGPSRKKRASGIETARGGSDAPAGAVRRTCALESASAPCASQPAAPCRRAYRRPRPHSQTPLRAAASSVTDAVLQKLVASLCLLRPLGAQGHLMRARSTALDK